MRKLKLSKKYSYRNRLIRNLVSSLILFEQIKTTGPKAKAVKAEMESLIAKLNKFSDEVTAKRYLASYLYGGAKQKAYDYKDSFKSVRLYKLDTRIGDGSQVVLVKLDKSEPVSKPKEKEVAEKPKSKAKKEIKK